MDPALLDTDILSELLKQRNPSVRTKGAAYLNTHGQFTMSAFTRFEVSRGYKEKQATTFLTDPVSRLAGKLSGISPVASLTMPHTGLYCGLRVGTRSGNKGI